MPKNMSALGYSIAQGLVTARHLPAIALAQARRAGRLRPRLPTPSTGGQVRRMPGGLRRSGMD
jgi:hypothetical protein